MCQPPVISVVMTAYNAEKYIAESIKSILNQTFTDFEFLIYNDGSTDQTQAVIEGFKDPRIKTTNLSKNKGVVYCANLGMKEAIGKYIVRFDADDISPLNRFQLHVDYMEANPSISLSSGYLRILGTSEIVKKPLSDNEIRWWLFKGCPIIQGACVIRREVLTMNNLSYDPDFKSAEDLELWFQIAKHTKMGNIPEILLEYRVHAEQESTANIERQNEYRQKSLVSFFSYLGINHSYDNIYFAESLFSDILSYTSENLVKVIHFFKSLDTPKAITFFGVKEISDKESLILKRFVNNLVDFSPSLLFRIAPRLLWKLNDRSLKRFLIFIFKCSIGWKTRLK